MAKNKGKTKAKAAPAPEPEAEEAVPASRSRMWLHEGMKVWLDEQTGDDIDTYSAADIISLAFAKRNEWRDSDEYQALLDEHGVARRGAAKPEKPAKTAKADKKAAAADTATAKPAKARKGKAKAAPADEDQPFE